MIDVCHSIYASLEGAKKWTAYGFAGIEREAYIESFEECQRLVKENALHPKEMLQALSDYHDTLYLLPKPSFFSMARWFYAPLEARDTAVRTAFKLVDGICIRFLQ